MKSSFFLTVIIFINVLSSCFSRAGRSCVGAQKEIILQKGGGRVGGAVITPNRSHYPGRTSSIGIFKNKSLLIQPSAGVNHSAGAI